MIIDGQGLARAFERNRWLVRAQAKGLGHEDSLVQTEFNINCFNWVVGHLVASRGDLLVLLGGEPVVGPEAIERYRRESDPITEDGPDVLAFDRLLGALDETQHRLADRLSAISAAGFAKEIEGDGSTETLGRRAHFWYFHDTYHSGQTELLRQVTGVGDRVI